MITKLASGAFEVAAVIFLLGVIMHSAPQAPADEVARPTVAELIERLGSSSFKERELANLQLKERKDALPFLRKAALSSNKEISKRASAILEEFARRALAERTQRLKVLARAGQVDQLAELVSTWPPGKEETTCWLTVFQFTEALLGRDLQSGGFVHDSLFAKTFHDGRLPLSHIVTMKALTRVPDFPFKVDDAGVPAVPERAFFARTSEVALKSGIAHPTRAIIVCSGPAKIGKIEYGILFALGPVEVDTAIHSVIITDADATVYECQRSMVIARGKLKIGADFVQSQGWSHTRVEFVNNVRMRWSTAIQAQEKSLDFIRFFDPLEIGIDVRPDLSIRRCGEKSAFASAGLQEGDIIESLDGQPTSSYEAFRATLRSRAALGGPALFQLRRGNNIVNREVMFP